MFAVVFEAFPAANKKNEYLENTKLLKSILESIDGFIDNERFESKHREGWILSLSTWRDEKSVIRWRTQSKHHGVQEAGSDVPTIVSSIQHRDSRVLDTLGFTPRSAARSSQYDVKNAARTR